MKILLDTLQAGNQSGTGTYALALSEWLPQVLPEAQVAVVCSGDLLQRFQHAGIAEAFACSKTRAPIGTVARTLQMRQAIQSFSPDIVHYPASFARLTGRGGLRSARMVVTVHDLSFMRHPEWFTRRRSLYYRAAIIPTVRSADLILADSGATAADLETRLGVQRARIDVTHLGVDERFAPASSESIGKIRERLGLPDRFFLYLGTIEPRKNLARLIGAFDAIAAKCELDLVIAGREGWRTAEFRQAMSRSRFRSRIQAPGFIDASDMPALMSAADIFVWPSLWEGFGLPPLEAMACGTPVITSSTSSLPEVVGDAALTVQPEDTAAIAEAMNALAVDADLRAKLATAGLARARRFTWRRTAELTAAAYRRIVAA